MFETAELGRKIPKSDYKKNEPVLRQELLDLQVRLRRQAQSQVILVFAGVDGAGKGETVNMLNEWMDPRWLITRAFDEPVDVEKERPEFWRYWLALPPRGRIGMFLSSWYHPAVIEQVYGSENEAELERRLERISTFENELVDDGAIILKFWMHLSQDAQKTRLKALEKDPLTRARVSERDWNNWKKYDKFVAAAERIIMRTNSGKAPWNIVEGLDPNFRSLTVGTILRDTLSRRLDEVQIETKLKNEIRTKTQADIAARIDARIKAAGTDEPTGGDASVALTNEKASTPEKHPKDQKDDAQTETDAQHAPPVTVLSQLDMSKSLDKSTYQKSLRKLQARLHELHLKARQAGVSTILVFEGPDASGKGGAIRRLTAAMDARNCQVHGFAAPTDEEKAQHHLWRFWRHLQRAGRFTIFDRSWYGRVLVERVEGFASEDEWRRAYAEINDFEAQLIEHGTVLVKIWIHITKNEQLERFRLREVTPHKRWKLTEEDWRNREKWDDYALAVNDMVQYTSTSHAPWTLVEGNNKHFARIKSLETVCERLEQALQMPRAASREASMARV
jgi:AMP-polyphosphate phosphotransferase